MAKRAHDSKERVNRKKHRRVVEGEDESQMSDAADEDYSDDEPVAKRSDEAKRKILNFLMNATLSELQTVESISALKARVVHEARPFKSLSEFKLKSQVVKKAKFFNDQLLANVEEALKGRTMVTNLLKKCESTTKKLRAALADNAGGLSIKKPKMMSEHLTLKPYQHRGLYWYTTIHEMNIGAILADEMGLGKTVQTISFLAWLKENQPSFRRPHLVVCPSSTLENWRREFECWLPSFKVHSYYGEHRRHDLRKIIRLKQNMKDKFKKQVESDLDDDEDDVDNEGEKENKVDSSEKDADQFENIDVVLTTYQSACSGEQDRVALKKLGVGYAIFDEGHMLKNMKTQRYQQLMKIGAKRRILLTGTPLQNNLLELMSLLKFIMPEMLEKSTSTLTKIFQLSNSESDFARKRALEAKAILDPFVMRRIKANVLKDLPPKTDETMNVKLPDFQRAFYDEIKTNARLELAKRENGSEGTQKRLKNFYMELRKTANHPLLLRRHFTNDKLRKMAKILCNNEMRAEGNVDYIFEDFEVMSDFEIHRTCEKYHSLKKFRLKSAQIVKSAKFDKLMELMPPLFDKDSRVVLFSQFTMMMDIMEVLMDHHQIGFLRLDGSTPVESRLDLIDEFNADFDIKVFMISTKAGGLGINLTSADTVIIHDIDSNPYNDKQAEDRCHRVGQTKPVHIIRLIAEDTVEIKMRASAVEKLKLESKVCHEDTIKYKTSPLKKPKIELDAKLDDSIIDEEEISQDELVGMLEEKT